MKYIFLRFLIKYLYNITGPQVSATIAIATVVHTLFYLSWTLRLFNRVTSTSWGPIALAM